MARTRHRSKGTAWQRGVTEVKVKVPYRVRAGTSINVLQGVARGVVEGGTGSEMEERMAAVEKRVKEMEEKLVRLEAELLHERMESAVEKRKEVERMKGVVGEQGCIFFQAS